MFRRRFWPDRNQLLLLQVCLLTDKEAARSAWKEWSGRVNLDDLDPSSFRIMSLVYRRLVELGINSPDLARIKGIYRYHWTRNQVAWRGKADLLRALQGKGIEVLLLKGAALGPTVYPEPTARGMHDLDFLVPTADAARAVGLLRERGWIEQHFDVLNTIQYFHGCSFLHPDFGEADLHWHVMRSHCDADRDAELWAAARPFSYAGLNAKMLCPADQFLHACEHGQHHSLASALQWLVDATLILLHDPATFDWPRLIDQARKFRLVLCVRQTLRYVQRHFNIAVPEEVTRELALSPVPWLERLELVLANRPSTLQHGLVRRVALAACHHLKAAPHLSWHKAMTSFSLYYRLITHERREWAVVYSDWKLTMARRLMDGAAGIAFRAWTLVRRGSWPRGGLITRLPADALTGFHRVETERGSLFRWSQPEASLRLTLPPSHKTIRLGLRPFRDLALLQEDGLQFALDGQTLPATQVVRNGDFLTIRPDPQQLAVHEPHTLSWKVAAWPADDPRELGLPVSRIWTF